MHAPTNLTPTSIAPPLIDDDGTIAGYASLFGAVDLSRDMVVPGAFRDTLQVRGLNRIPMLFQHDPAEPIGVWIELKEDWRADGSFPTCSGRGRCTP